MNKRTLFLSLLLLFTAVGGLRTALAGPPDDGAKAQVKIDNFSFSPSTLTVKAGTTVTWINRDDIPHTIVSTDQAFKSKAIDTDEGFTFTLTKPGTYNYFCSIHPKMTGRVIVEP